ncbi:MAG TPA: sigma 54-interacting transcriptional regulator [Acidobacteriota bacterium]|nr:sigma 54-interacting transcriptional regulator [Acidobacteriota bacterium]
MKLKFLIHETASRGGGDRVGAFMAENGRVEFEELISSISARFVDLSPDSVDSEIERALKEVAEFFHVDRCGLLSTLPDKKYYKITHVFQAIGVPQLPVNVPIALSDFPWTSRQLLEEGLVCTFKSIDELPPEASVDRQTRIASGTRSAVDIPILRNGRIDHFIGMNAVKEEIAWPVEYIPRLRLLGEILVSALQKKQKDESIRELLAEVQGLKNRLEQENVYLRNENRFYSDEVDILGKSAEIRKVLSLVQQVAPTESTVLLLGETGTGKELVAQAVHRMSHRKDRLMVRVNCASLPAELVESELFGREKGAYTGALTKQIGRFELADHSTILLDEIGELPLGLQSKLLRVLERGEFERLGSPRTLRVDVRIIAATNRNLAEAVETGKFREDLFYRLKVFPIEIPPLRQRTEDIPLMAHAFLTEFSVKLRKEVPHLFPATMKALQEYRWPGNVRELRNVLEQAMILNEGGPLEAALSQPRTGASLSPQSFTLEEMEYWHIVAALDECGWHIKGRNGAAEKLGLKPSTLYTKMEKLGIHNDSASRKRLAPGRERRRDDLETS